MDTSPEAYEVQLRLIRAMSMGERMERMLQFSDDMLRLVADGIRARHPDYDDKKVHWAFLRLRLGDDLFRRVWPQGPMVAP